MRLGFQVGADYDLGFAVVGLTGRLDFDSAVPKVTNPTSLGPEDSPGETARLGTSPKVGGMIMGRIVVPLRLP